MLSIIQFVTQKADLSNSRPWAAYINYNSQSGWIYRSNHPGLPLTPWGLTLTGVLLVFLPHEYSLGKHDNMTDLLLAILFFKDKHSNMVLLGRD